MSKNNLDQLIEQKLMESQNFGENIDVRKETMSRIEALEIKREKVKYVFTWILSLFSTAACLASLVFFENIFNRFRHFFILINLDPLVLKLVFQGIFACIFLGILCLMIYTLNSKEQLFHIPEV